MASRYEKCENYKVYTSQANTFWFVILVRKLHIPRRLFCFRSKLLKLNDNRVIHWYIIDINPIWQSAMIINDHPVAKKAWNKNCWPKIETKLFVLLSLCQIEQAVVGKADNFYHWLSIYATVAVVVVRAHGMRARILFTSSPIIT